jgi:hypothetical protein
MNNFDYNELTKLRKVYIDGIVEHGTTLGIDLEKDTFCRAELRQISMSMKGKKWIPNWITHDHARRAGKGVFHLPEVHQKYAAENAVTASQIRPSERGTVPPLAEKKVSIREKLEAAIDAEVPYEEMAW